jgi:hypothetical protein
MYTAVAYGQFLFVFLHSHLSENSSKGITPAAIVRQHLVGPHSNAPSEAVALLSIREIYEVLGEAKQDFGG